MCCIVLSCQPSTQCLRVSASVGLSTMVTTAGHVEHQPAAGVVVESVLLPEAARLCGLVLVCFSTKRTSGMPGCMDVGTPWSASPCVVAQSVLARCVAKGCSRLRIKKHNRLHASCIPPAWRTVRRMTGSAPTWVPAGPCACMMLHRSAVQQDFMQLLSPQTVVGGCSLLWCVFTSLVTVGVWCVGMTCEHGRSLQKPDRLTMADWQDAVHSCARVDPHYAAAPL